MALLPSMAGSVTSYGKELWKSQTLSNYLKWVFNHCSYFRKMLLRVTSEGILEENTELSAPLQLRHWTKIVSQEGHRTISLWVQTPERYCMTTKNVLLYSDGCKNPTNDLPFIPRSVLRKSLHPVGSFSVLLHPRKCSSGARKVTTAQLLWAVSYIVCRK